MHTKKRASNVGESTLTSAKTLLQWLDASTDISDICLFFKHMDTEKGKGWPRKEMFSTTIHNSNGSTFTVPMDAHFISEKDFNEFEQEMQPLCERLQVDSKIFLGVAWVRRQEQRLFQLFPEVIWCDVTLQTNRDNFFVNAGVSSTGEAFSALWAFLSYERLWVFSWQWPIACHRLLGTDNVSRNKICLSDGNNNIYNAFDSARDSHFPKSMHGLCLYHLVLQPLQKMALCNKNQESIKKILTTFRSWLYTWMRPGEIETNHEYDHILRFNSVHYLRMPFFGVYGIPCCHVLSVLPRPLPEYCHPRWLSLCCLLQKTRVWFGHCSVTENGHLTTTRTIFGTRRSGCAQSNIHKRYLSM